MTFLGVLASWFGVTRAHDEERVYDGVERVYDSEDPSRPCPPGLLPRILGFDPDRDGLRYAMSFYAGGTGVTDHVAIRCRCSEAQRDALTRRLSLRDLDAIRSDARWVVDFAWLVGLETGTDFARGDCESFIDSHRSAFQDPAAGSAAVRFAFDSDVNSWWAVWHGPDRTNILGFDQG